MQEIEGQLWSRSAIGFASFALGSAPSLKWLGHPHWTFPFHGSSGAAFSSRPHHGQPELQGSQGDVTAKEAIGASVPPWAGQRIRSAPSKEAAEPLSQHYLSQGGFPKKIPEKKFSFTKAFNCFINTVPKFSKFWGSSTVWEAICPPLTLWQIFFLFKGHLFLFQMLQQICV